MSEKDGIDQKVLRRDFIKIITAAGFGTAIGTYLFSVPGYDFDDGLDTAEHSSGVLYRIKEADLSTAKSFSICEMILEPGAKTFVMYNKESIAAYEGISGQAVILSAATLSPQKDARAGKQKVTKGGKMDVRPGWHFQLVNPSRERVKVVQQFKPIWKPDKAFIKVGRKTIPGSDLWFELRESEKKKGTGLKYKLISTTNRRALLDVRIDPGVKSPVEFYKKCVHEIKVTVGTGIVVKDGKKQVVKVGDKLTFERGSKFRFINPSKSDRWEVKMRSRPGWRPEDAFYLAGDRTIRGADVWFGIRLG